MTSVQITLNGEKYALPSLEATTLGHLLKTLKIAPEGRIVEHNGEIYNAKNGLDRPVSTGDTIEIIQMMGGGTLKAVL